MGCYQGQEPRQERNRQERTAGTQSTGTHNGRNPDRNAIDRNTQRQEHTAGTHKTVGTHTVGTHETVGTHTAIKFPVPRMALMRRRRSGMALLFVSSVGALCHACMLPVEEFAGEPHDFLLSCPALSCLAISGHRGISVSAYPLVTRSIGATLAPRMNAPFALDSQRSNGCLGMSYQSSDALRCVCKDSVRVVFSWPTPITLSSQHPRLGSS